MKELELKYGCNPNQKPARIFMEEGELPVTVLNGKPGYINFLDALNSWQLVKELKEATGLPAAASFKHVSPAGAALGLPLDDALRKMYFVGDKELSPLACAYARARGADRMSSYGDWAALSDVCDAATAQLIKHEVSDGVIAPGYTEEALDILRTKKKGNYNVVQIDPDYIPAPMEHKDVFGVTFEQGRNDSRIDEKWLENLVTENKHFTDEQKRDLLRNGEKFVSAIQGALWNLGGGDEGGGALSGLREAGSALSGARGLDGQFAQLCERLDALYSEAYDVTETLRDMESAFDFSPRELDALESRADQLYRLKKKYGPTVEDMLEYLDGDSLKSIKCRPQLAEDIDISDTYMGAIERGERSLTLDTLVRLVNRLGVTIDYLLSDSVMDSDANIIEQFKQIIDCQPLERKQMAINVLRAIFSYFGNENI